MVKLHLAKVLTFGLVMCLGVSLVVAQEQGQGQGQRRQGGGGGGRGGFGGFGGGGFGGGSRGVLGLISNEAVQKELAVDADTTAKLKKVSDDVRAELTAGAPQGGGREAFQGLSDEERRAKMAELQKKGAENTAKVVAKFQPQLKEILSETQYTRLQQIYWQSSLDAALADPEVIKAIDLTKEQQDKIAAVGKEMGDKIREAFGGGRGGAGGGGGAGAGGGFAKIQELNKERETKTLDVLSAEQKDKFASLKGKAFDVALLRPNFGGGRGGPGGRPAGAGGRPAAETEKKDEEKK